MLNVTVHSGTKTKREITITGCDTVVDATAVKYPNVWNIYLNNGDVLYSPTLRGIEFEILNHLKGHMQ